MSRAGAWLPVWSAWKQGFAFFAVYLLWGTNYLAIRFALEGMPPLMMMGLRCALAASVLFGWGRLRAHPWPARRQVLSAAPGGALLFMGGHGLLAVAQTKVSSGLASLVFGSVPMWMVVFGGARETRSRSRLILGVAIGFTGVAVLLAPAWSGSETRADATGVLCLLGAAGSWAAGSICSARADLPASPAMKAGLLLAVGAVLLLPLAVARGERVVVATLSAGVVAAFVYMVIVGSLLCFAAYIWLLEVRGAPEVGAYTFVNPMVAVLVGWAIAAEALDGRMLVACALIVVGVALVHAAGVPPHERKETTR